MEEADRKDVEIPRHRIPDSAGDRQQVHKEQEDGECQGIQDRVKEGH